MLPDYLKVKKQLQKMLQYRLDYKYLSNMGPLANIPESMVFEGNQTVLIREDGSVDDRDPAVAITDIRVELSEVERMNPAIVLNKIDKAAEEMARQLGKAFYEEIGRLADEGDQVVAVDANAFSIDTYFEMLERIELDFDDAGNPGEIMAPVHPKHFPAVKAALEKAKGNPEAERRYHEIIERRREDFRVRESNRKLVG